MRVSLKAVGLGIATDLGLTNLLLLPVVGGVIASPAIQALPASAQSAAWLAMLTAPSSPVYTIGMVLGALASACGGWVAAAVAERDELLHGALSAVGCMALGLYSWRSGSDATSPATHFAFFVLSPALGVLGAAVRRRGVRRARERAPVSAAHRGGRWVVLALDYLMIAVSVFVTIVYVTLGVIAPTAAAPYEAATVVVLASYGVALFALYAAAAHALRTGHRYRWPAHAVAVGLTVLPLVLAR